MNALMLAIALVTLNEDGVSFGIEANTRQIDPGHSLTLDVTLKTPKELAAALPDLRGRVRGFSLAEDVEEEPTQDKNGTITRMAQWHLVPEPCAKEYKIAPFVVAGKLVRAIYFDPPAPLPAATGAMEIDPKKDFPPLSWKLVRLVALALAGLALAAAAAWQLVKTLVRRVKEHRMSPIERAWAELDRLLKKGLPGRGRYKDFYVELTQLVRRYVQRQHGVNAPHLTTEEFFDVARQSPSFPKNALEELMDFLRKADMVKFAGVSATPETTDEATQSARVYIVKDDEATRAVQQAGGKGGEP